MPNPTRADTLPTQQFPALHVHPDNSLKDYPYPKLVREPKEIRSSKVIAVQTGPVKAIHIASGWADAEKISSLPGTTILLGDPLDDQVPQTSTRNVVTLPAPYVRLFERLNGARFNRHDGQRGVMFTTALPAGIWLAFRPSAPNEPYGVLSISDGRGDNSVSFFPSKESGLQILADHSRIYHGDIPGEIEQSSLPERSDEKRLELTGDLADWFMACDFLSRP